MPASLCVLNDGLRHIQKIRGFRGNHPVFFVSFHVLKSTSHKPMGKATNTAQDTGAAAPAGASRKAPATVTRKRPATMAKAKPPPMAKAKAATARTKPATVAASSAITIGYARVSTHQQSLALQLDALEPLCSRIYQETVSGAGNVPRPQLEECIKEPLHKFQTHVLAHARRVRQHPGPCSNLISV